MCQPPLSPAMEAPALRLAARVMVCCMIVNNAAPKAASDGVVSGSSCELFLFLVEFGSVIFLFVLGAWFEGVDEMWEDGAVNLSTDLVPGGSLSKKFMLQLGSKWYGVFYLYLE